MIALTPSRSFDYPSHKPRTVRPAQPTLPDPCDNLRTSSFSLYQDAFRDTFQPQPRPPPRKIKHNHSHTLASSTRGGLDLYTRESDFQLGGNALPHYSCFNELDEDISFDARLAFSLEESLEAQAAEDKSFTDEGFFEAKGGRDDKSFNLVCFRELDIPYCLKRSMKKSRFSMTTTSTSNYIEVDSDIRREATPSPTWSTLELPDDYSESLTPTSTPRRRLHKRRPAHLESPTASPRKSPSSRHDSFSSADKLGVHSLVRHLPSIPRLRRDSTLTDKWVCVDVEQKITQRMV